MKLIDAPIGIFRFDGELVLKTEYCSENKLSGKYIPDCYIVRTGEYFWGGAKTANELNNLDVEPVDFAKLLPTVTDTISRQAAIKILHEALDAADQIADVPFGVYQNYRDKMNELPSAQPEIIRCKDCKHWIPYDWMFSEVWQSRNINDYPEDEIGCNYCDMAMKANDFCSRAERKEVTE